MKREPIGNLPPQQEGGEGEQNEKLLARAEELSAQLQELRTQHKGEYPRKSELIRDDAKIHYGAEDFFERDCRDLPSVEVGRGANGERDELKKLSDSVWMLKEVEANWDLNEHEYSIIDRERAIELLTAIIEEKKKKIKALEEQNLLAEKLIGEA